MTPEPGKKTIKNYQFYQAGNINVEYMKDAPTTTRTEITA